MAGDLTTVRRPMPAIRVSERFGGNGTQRAKWPEPTAAELRRGPVAVVRLDLIRSNYAILAEKSGNAECAAIVKGDGYGLGMVQSARVCQEAGAKTFFVARFDDGVELRNALADVRIAVLDGLGGVAPSEFEQHGLTPVIGSVADLETWCTQGSRTSMAYIHFDTAMNRLGIRVEAAEQVRVMLDEAAGRRVAGYLTHFSSADDVDLELCRQQVAKFRRAIARLPRAPISVVNSSGLYLDPRWRGDLTRPGKALAGINPLPPGSANPVHQVMTVTAPILQVATIRRGEAVGYSEAFRATRPMRVATVGIGYANGYPRALSGRGIAVFGGQRAPLIGRVSMDLITIDVTGVPEAALAGGVVELLGPSLSLTEYATLAETNEYEAQIALGRGCRRCHVDHAT